MTTSDKALRRGGNQPSQLKQTIMAMAAQGRDIVQLPDRLSAALWGRARREGYVTGDLYVVSEPIPSRLCGGDARSAQPNQAMATMEGAYYRDSGDVWILNHPDEPWRGPQTLIHELAHAVRPETRPETIDQDWNEEIATWLTASQLLQDLGIPELLNILALHDIIDETETLRRHHHAAARLVGTTCPLTARAAYAALIGLAGAMTWTQAHFEDVLDGKGDVADREAILDLDRSALRSYWLSDSTVIDIATYVHAQNSAMAQTLRSALLFASSETVPGLDAFTLAVTLCGCMRRADATVTCEMSLGVAIHRAMGALLAHPDCRARAIWTLFADEVVPARWYRLQVFYEPLTSEQAAPVRAELWIKIGDSEFDQPILDGALQRFIASWEPATTFNHELISFGFDAHGNMA